jgi:hypothetical protein
MYVVCNLHNIVFVESAVYWLVQGRHNSKCTFFILHIHTLSTHLHTYTCCLSSAEHLSSYEWSQLWLSRWHLPLYQLLHTKLPLGQQKKVSSSTAGSSIYSW